MNYGGGVPNNGEAPREIIMTGDFWEDGDATTETYYLKQEPYEPKKDFSRAGYAIAAFVVAWQVIVSLLALAVVLVFSHVTENKESVSNITIVLSIVGEVLSIPVYYYIIKPIPAKKIEKKSMKFGHLFAALCIVFFLGIVGNIVGLVINSLLLSHYNVKSVSELTGMITVRNYWLIVFFGVFFAPPIEEMVCRKLLIDRINKYGKRRAMLVSGIIFALIHGNLEQFGYALLVGCFLAFVYIKTGKIIYTIGLHMCMNGYSMILAFFLNRIPPEIDINENITQIIDQLGKDNKAAAAFVAVIGLSMLEYFFAFIGLIFILTHLSQFTLKGEDEKEPPASQTYFAPGMIVCYLVLLAIMVYSFIGG